LFAEGPRKRNDENELIQHYSTALSNHDGHEFFYVMLMHFESDWHLSWTSHQGTRESQNVSAPVL
jgi:hypothetical protein